MSFSHTTPDNHLFARELQELYAALNATLTPDINNFDYLAALLLNLGGEQRLYDNQQVKLEHYPLAAKFGLKVPFNLSVMAKFVETLNQSVPQLNAQIALFQPNPTLDNLVCLVAMDMPAITRTVIPKLPLFLQHNPIVLEINAYSNLVIDDNFTALLDNTGINLFDTDVVENTILKIVRSNYKCKYFQTYATCTPLLKAFNNNDLPYKVATVIAEFLPAELALAGDFSDGIYSNENYYEYHSEYLNTALFYTDMPLACAHYVADYFNQLIPASAYLNPNYVCFPGNSTVFTQINIHNKAFLHPQFLKHFALAIKHMPQAELDNYRKQSHTLVYSTEECVRNLRIYQTTIINEYAETPQQFASHPTNKQKYERKFLTDLNNFLNLVSAPGFKFDDSHAEDNSEFMQLAAACNNHIQLKLQSMASQSHARLYASTTAFTETLINIRTAIANLDYIARQKYVENPRLTS